MDLSVIYDSIVPDNIKELPVVKASLSIFIELLNRNSQIAQRINRIYNIDNGILKNQLWVDRSLPKIDWVNTIMLNR